VFPGHDGLADRVGDSAGDLLRLLAGKPAASSRCASFRVSKATGAIPSI
jgi:hypothetical protein